MLTKTNFLTEYEKNIRYTYSATWAKDENRVKHALRCCEATLGMLTEKHQVVDHTGSVFVATWKQLGGKGKPTLKALNALPL
jgi:hypothetical protein